LSTIEAGRTQERLKQADGHVSVGGENKQRRYTFRDEVLTRTYEPLIRSAKTDRRRTRCLTRYTDDRGEGGGRISSAVGVLDRIGGRVLNAADYERGVETNA
jgi:hypothetical protein